MDEIIEATKLLNETADDYGQKGSGKKPLPSEEEINELIFAAKRVLGVVHLQEINEMARHSP
jgi:hypothetical protein